MSKEKSTAKSDGMRESREALWKAREARRAAADEAPAAPAREASPKPKKKRAAKR